MYLTVIHMEGYGMSIVRKLVGLVVVLVLAFSGAAQVVVETPADLDGVRWDAMDLIQAGHRLDAAVLLLQALRALPGDRVDLALPAVGSIQLLTFTNEYLMTQEECKALYAEHLDEKRSLMEKFLTTLIRYMDDGGVTQEEANRYANDILQLSQCDHLPVRLGALFTMASPYYFYDTSLAQRGREYIINEFPNEFMAQEAQRLSLYYARTQGAAGLRETWTRQAKTVNCVRIVGGCVRDMQVEPSIGR